MAQIGKVPVGVPETHDISCDLRVSAKERRSHIPKVECFPFLSLKEFLKDTGLSCRKKQRL